MSCNYALCQPQYFVPNDGSGLGLGSNLVAVVTGRPSTYTYSWWLNEQNKVAAVVNSGPNAPRNTGRPPRYPVPKFVFRTRYQRSE